MGKIKISQRLVPLDPWMDAIPRSATSDEVSKPKPNITPRGYIFQGLGGEHSKSQAVVEA
jgi:hypothetical protein